MNCRLKRGRAMPFFVATFLLAAWSSVAAAADLKEAQQKFLSGNYIRCIALAEQALRDRPDDEEWQLLLSQSLLTTGRYLEAYQAITNARAQESRRIRL